MMGGGVTVVQSWHRVSTLLCHGPAKFSSQNVPLSDSRYSPARIIGAEKPPMFGGPEEDKIGTSHIERFNSTVRMTLRRFTRLTNAHSKSQTHHAAMQALLVARYNFRPEA